MSVRYPAAKDRADAALIVRHLLELIDGGELDAPTWYQHRLVGVLLTLDPQGHRAKRNHPSLKPET